MKGHPDEWRVKNEAALKRVTGRANLQIYEEMIRRKEKLLAKISSTILSADEEDKFKRYKLMNHDDFQCYMSTLYHLLMAAVRSSDRSLMLQYIDDIAIRRFAEGFEPEELCNTLLVFKEIIITELTSTKELRNIKQDIYDYIGLTIQLAQDEIEDLYENLLQKMPRDKIAESSMLPDCKELQRKIRQLSAFYQISPDEAKNYTERFDN
jgi:chromosomal replication initiation ATPase DnaA